MSLRYINSSESLPPDESRYSWLHSHEW